MRFILFFLAAISAFASEPIRIGVILPLTGNNAHAGVRCQRALQMSLAEIPAESAKNYKIIVEDSQADPKLSLLAAKRLIEMEHVDVLFSFSASAFKVIAPLAKKKDVLHIGLSISHELADGRNNFSFWGLPEDGARLLVKRLKQDGKTKVAVLNVLIEASVLQTKAFVAEARRQGLDIVAEESFNPDERDFRLLLAKLREKSPDVVFVYAWMPGIDIIMRQRKQMGWTVPMTSLESFSMAEDRSLLEGMWYATSLHASGAFLERYRRCFGAGGDLFESNFYDMLQCIVEARERLPLDSKPTRQQLTESLGVILRNRPSVSGVLSVNEHGNIIVPTILAKISSGQIVPLE